MKKNYSNESVLLEELKKRNPQAYEYLYNSTIVRLTILAVSILQDEEAAKDLLQEFFIDVWEDHLCDNIELSLNAYLYYSVRNRAFRVKKTLQAAANPIGNAPTAERSELPRYFENQELKTRIDSAIESLSPISGKAFRMHYFEHLSHQEIATILGISKQTVGNHIHKALQDLRNRLKKNL